MRRATPKIHQWPGGLHHFYPRSPCGERLNELLAQSSSYSISIHALLAESDWKKSPPMCSILHFYPRSPCGERPCVPGYDNLYQRYFYPRSPCGERPHPIGILVRVVKISIHALLAESDGLFMLYDTSALIFLSTLSLRRATLLLALLICPPPDFYPRSPCGERPKKGINPNKTKHFYPRSPCGERPNLFIARARALLFLSTLSLRRATLTCL